MFCALPDKNERDKRCKDEPTEVNKTQDSKDGA